MDKKRLKKSEMIEKKLIKETQTWGNYVLYYIFYHEDPIYVGITNNFKMRKSQHFSASYRASDRGKKLYKHIEDNCIEDYSMYVIAQSIYADDIERLEVIHIKKLKDSGFAETNVADGGRYVKYYNTTKRLINEFYEHFTNIEEEATNEDYELDLEVFSNGIDGIDWCSLYSIVDCSEHTVFQEYERYERYEKKQKKEPVSFDEYMGGTKRFDNSFRQILSPNSLLNIVMAGDSVRKDVKEGSLRSFIYTIEYLESTESQLEKYVGLKFLFEGYDEDVIPPIAGGLDIRYDDIIDRVFFNGYKEDIF